MKRFGRPVIDLERHRGGTERKEEEISEGLGTTGRAKGCTCTDDGDTSWCMSSAHNTGVLARYKRYPSTGRRGKDVEAKERQAKGDSEAVSKTKRCQEEEQRGLGGRWTQQDGRDMGKEKEVEKQKERRGS